MSATAAVCHKPQATKRKLEEEVEKEDGEVGGVGEDDVDEEGAGEEEEEDEKEGEAGNECATPPLGQCEE